MDKFNLTSSDIDKIRKGDRIKGLSILRHNLVPVKTEFNSITQAARFLRTTDETVKKSLEKSIPINGYIVSISQEKMQVNQNKTKHLR